MKDIKYCRYCGGRVKKTTTRKLYGSKHVRSISCCVNCNAFVTNDPVTLRPIGTIANTLLRSLRREAHDAFDKHCSRNGMTRAEGYTWLSEIMGISRSRAHFALFDVEECKVFLERCRTFKNVS